MLDKGQRALDDAAAAIATIRPRLRRMGDTGG